MLKLALAAIMALFLIAPAASRAQDADNAASNAAPAQPDFSWVDSLPRQSGVIQLAGTNAQLDLGSSYDFIDATDARRVLTEVWGNPPDVADGVLGIVLPKGGDPRDGRQWGAVVTYLDTGYVSDKDAATTDYNKLLDSMRQGEEQDNQERQSRRLPTIHLVGWAEPPRYDAGRHVLVWARDLAASDGNHTLNYDIRVLGRRGVVSLNVLAPLASLGDVNDAAASIGATARFSPGARYADYDSAHDKTAAYGIGGLIAAGAGVAVAKKLGLLGLILAFGKKAFVLIAAALAAAGAWFRRTFAGFFGRGRPPASGGDIVT